MLLSLFILARGTLKFLFRLKLDSQLLRGGKSSCSLWSELQVMESKTLVVIDCQLRESVSKLAWCNASLYGTKGKISRMARFCSCSSSADKYAASTLWNTGHAYSDFDWLKQISYAAGPIRSAIQTWVVTRCQHGISALVSQTSFRGKTSGGVAKCRLFFSQTSFCLLRFFFSSLFGSVLFCYFSGSKQLMVDFFRKLVK